MLTFIQLIKFISILDDNITLNFINYSIYNKITYISYNSITSNKRDNFIINKDNNLFFDKIKIFND